MKYDCHCIYRISFICQKYLRQSAGHFFIEFSKILGAKFSICYKNCGIAKQSNSNILYGMFLT